VLVDRAVLGFPAFWAPAAVRDAVVDGEVQRGPVRAGLPARNDLQACQAHAGFSVKRSTRQTPSSRFTQRILFSVVAASVYDWDSLASREMEFSANQDAKSHHWTCGLSVMFAVLVDASAGWRGIKITLAISRELDALMTDSKAKPGVRVAA
jgi:hypothetical protein